MGEGGGGGGVDLRVGSTAACHALAVVAILDALHAHSLDLNAPISVLPDQAAIAPIAVSMAGGSPA